MNMADAFEVKGTVIESAGVSISDDNGNSQVLTMTFDAQQPIRAYMIGDIAHIVVTGSWEIREFFDAVEKMQKRIYG